jgi:hypothetical protein
MNGRRRSPETHDRASAARRLMDLLHNLLRPRLGGSASKLKPALRRRRINFAKEPVWDGLWRRVYIARLGGRSDIDPGGGRATWFNGGMLASGRLSAGRASLQNRGLTMANDRWPGSVWGFVGWRFGCFGACGPLGSLFGRL